MVPFFVPRVYFEGRIGPRRNEAIFIKKRVDSLDIG